MESRPDSRGVADGGPPRSNFETAVAWLTDNLDSAPRPLVPSLKQAFNLSNLDACEALRIARLRREGGQDG